MDAKTYLKQAYLIDTQINCKLEQVLSLRELATKATSLITGMPRKGTRNVHSMQTVVEKIVVLEEEINNDIDTLVDLKSEIGTLIKAIEKPQLQRVLELRYLCYKSWSQIASCMGFTIQHTYRLHEEALKKFENLKSCE